MHIHSLFTVFPTVPTSIIVCFAIVFLNYYYWFVYLFYAPMEGLTESVLGESPGASLTIPHYTGRV